MDIVVCSHCKGSGEVERREDGHPRDAGWEIVKCSDCKGSGRKFRFEIVVEVPYVKGDTRKLGDLEYYTRKFAEKYPKRGKDLAEEFGIL